MTGFPVRHRSTPRQGAYVARALRELRHWSAVAVRETPDGVAVAVQGTSILRTSGLNEMRLRLTAPVIRRLEPQLWESGQVHACPDRAWVAVQVDTEPGMELLLALTSVAIQAHAHP
ncbi:luciferase family protein [Nonomuraea sp. NPDC050328]|uniref:luciferase domain-containing protein n=1 Tax=Nonomuraea sp. NPDC050328 TaxID=3364361 RepID=UPI003797AF69